MVEPSRLRMPEMLMGTLPSSRDGPLFRLFSLSVLRRGDSAVPPPNEAASRAKSLWGDERTGPRSDSIARPLACLERKREKEVEEGEVGRARASSAEGAVALDDVALLLCTADAEPDRQPEAPLANTVVGLVGCLLAEDVVWVAIDSRPDTSREPFNLERIPLH